MGKVDLAFECLYKARQKFSAAKLDHAAAIATASFYNEMANEAGERCRMAIKGNNIVAAEYAIADHTEAIWRMRMAIDRAVDSRERWKVASEEVRTSARLLVFTA